MAVRPCPAIFIAQFGESLIGAMINRAAPSGGHRQIAAGAAAFALIRGHATPTRNPTQRWEYSTGHEPISEHTHHHL